MSRRIAIRAGFAGLGLLATVFAIGLAARGLSQEPDAAAAKAAKSKAAFRTVALVLRNPRCLNCHTNTAFPRTGDARERHPQNVSRGDDGHGVPGLRCSTCHQAANQDLVGIPGAPNWHLAPLSMGWESLDDHDLAEALKDRKKNGDRSLADMLQHVADDPLVGWAWSPGKDRNAPPISRDDFVRAFGEWIDSGAVSPDPGNSTH